MKPTILVKISGKFAETEEIITKIAQALVFLQKTYSVILLHGGGSLISKYLSLLTNEESKFENGLRVTTKESVKIVEMVLNGLVNKTWVSAIQNQNQKTVGLSGVDAQTLICEPILQLQRVGKITQVNHQYVQTLIENKYLPVISPISSDKKGLHYNVNADEAAAAIAVQLKVSHLIFVSDISGVFDENKKVISKINFEKKQKLIQKQVIQDGMIPKIESAFEALRQGVQNVHICTFSHSKSILEQIQGNGLGTICIL